MPSSYTQSGVELIGNGEQSGTWGTTTNTNLQIIDRMVSQAGTISLSGTTHTLTISDGILSDGQYGVLVFGGSPSGTNTVTISPNDAQRTYIVKNDSGESVVLTQGSGGNVTVANGKTAIAYCDGAGSGAAVVDLSTTFASTLASLGVTASAAELNTLDGITATTAELNILDGVTATTDELNYVSGLTSAIQTQLDARALAATTISAGSGLTGGGSLAANRTLSHADTSAQDSVDNSGTTVIQDVTLDTYGHVTALGSVTLALADFSVTSTAAELNILDGATLTTTELNFVGGVTSSIQTQLDAKAANTTQAEAAWEAGTSTTETIVSPAKVAAAIAAQVASAGWTESAVQNATGLSQVNFTSLPSGITEVQILLHEISLSGNNLNMGVRLSTSGSFLTTGYNSMSYDNIIRLYNNDSFTVALYYGTTPLSGKMSVTRFSTDKWVQDHSMGGYGSDPNNDARHAAGGGSADFSGEIDGVRIFARSGSFDAGQVKIRYR